MSPENKETQYYIISIPTQSAESFESLMNHMPEWQIDSKADSLEDFQRELTRRAGRQGGFARAAKLTPAQRTNSARRAAEARWETPR